MLSIVFSSWFVISLRFCAVLESLILFCDGDVHPVACVYLYFLLILIYLNT